VTTKICPVCHSPIPAHAPGGLCPACLLRDAEDPPESGRAVPSIEEVAAAFPNLEVLEKIGQGGMGVVFKARQPALDRIVALKILLPELGRDPAFAERFAREARVLGKLNHPNIVTVFEHGERDGFFYLLMEYVDGVNLRQAMRAGRFTPDQALALVPGICDALQAAHAQGVWHRDIKPENILLDAAGGVKIADFGIARIVGDPHRDFTLTRTGNALGSAAYMAPEQHEKPHDVDHRADIYSLGVVIYEMLTGELPLGRFPAPSRRAEVNARVDEIVLRTLEKERELRQQSASEVKTDVQGAATVGSRGTTSAPTSGPAPNRLPSPVRWSLGLLLGGGVLMAAAHLVAESFRSPQTTSMMAVLIAIGGAAAACGLLASLWSLHEMKRGRMPATGRHLLVSLVCWPIMLGLSLLAAASWFKIFKRGDLSSEVTGALFSYALVAIAAPVVIARLMWSMFVADPTTPPTRLRGGVKSAIACVFVTGAIITAKFIVEREAAYHSYKARVIQIAGEISQPEEEDLAKVRAAVEQALGEGRSSIRYAVYGSRDPSSPWNLPRLETPYIVLEATSPNTESFRARAAEITARLRASLPKRLEVNPNADIPSAGDLRAPAALYEGYRHTRPLNAILLLVPLAVVLLVATTTQALPWLPVVLALISAAACGRSSWPGAPKELPPSIAGLQPLPPLAAPEYDFSTTRDAMESLIKAAKRKDVEGFQRGISGPVLQQALSQARDPGELMKLIASWSYSHQVSRDGNTARVRINSTNPADQHINWPMIRENGDWKLADPLGAFTSAASGTAVIAIGADGIVTVDGEASPPEKLGERIAALAKRRPASVIIRAAETIPYNRVTTILDECQKAGLANVSFQSKTAESPSTPGPVEHGR
jgi:biopolymer transport protein ExbD/tRNA A-37 threonylcarbamoyl transferase component Bud32